MSSSILESYKGVRQVVGRYWQVYGGWQSLVTSPYLHVSLLLTVATFGTWTQENWWEQVFSVVPNLLGFSLGGLAIFLGVGSEQFRSIISGRKPESVEKQSPYLTVAAALAHFVVVQILALLVAIVAAGAWKLPAIQYGVPDVVNDVARILFWLVGYWLFLYSICSAAAALFGVFRVASWFDEARTMERSRQGTSGERPRTDEQ